MRRLETRSDSGRALVFAVASMVLSYPDEVNDAALDRVLDREDEIGTSSISMLEPLIRHRRREPILQLQREYVDTFDLRRRCTLHLTYYLNGDTRRRGVALLAFQRVIADAGYRVSFGELPDFLPVVLELGARTDGAAAVSLLDAHRAGLRLLAEALGEASSPYEGAIRAVEAVLPPPAAGVLANARLMALMGPPREDVGLEFLTVGDGNGYGVGPSSAEVRR
jgi:nitrate reductase delta subunit